MRLAKTPLLMIRLVHCAPPFISNDDQPLCDAVEQAIRPCLCCKKECWYTIVSAATHELGYMPGEAGEQEALSTLKSIRQCVIENCAQVCLK
ncbi:unnamed protein product, partial [Mesorhabditis belari]|uniref:Uncharacterized protein n=1 Tax=Mesorhabditis belari TaxID=2138241 RepID=A0AAF3EIS6_9BILA